MLPGNQYILKLPLLINCMSAMMDKRDTTIVYIRIQLTLEFLIDVFETNVQQQLHMFIGHAQLYKGNNIPLNAF